MAKFGPSRTVTQTQKRPESGHFAIDKPELDWQKCREQFAKLFADVPHGFYFSHEPDQGAHVACFIERVEEILKAGGCEFPPTEFAYTNLKFALWVQPSPFWTSCAMRRSLFTILLRCGLLYDPVTDNFEKALYSEKYVSPTKDAVERFLFGFTQYVGTSDVEGVGKGWYTVFNNKDLEEIRKKLIRPDNAPVEPSFIGMGNIWS